MWTPVSSIGLFTDCHGRNEKARLSLKISSLFGSKPEITGLRGDARGRHKDVELAGQLADALCTLDGGAGIIFANTAPRNTDDRKTNGAPFVYFWTGETLVVTTIGGYTLSLVRTLELTQEVSLLDLPTVVAYMRKEGVITRENADEIVGTQFRSLLFAPIVAQCLIERKPLPHQCMPINAFAEIQKPTVWMIDPFNNRKLTATWEETEWKQGDQIATNISKASIPFIRRLTDVPPNTIAFTVGSSGGKGTKHFIELVVNGGDPGAYLERTLDIGEEIMATVIRPKGKEEYDGNPQRDERCAAKSPSACGC